MMKSSKKKLLIAKLICVFLFFACAVVTGVTFALESYTASLVFIVLTVIACVAMIVLMRTSYRTYPYLGSELVLHVGVSRVTLMFEGTEYPMTRAQKTKYNSVYCCTLNNGSEAETMISSSGKVYGIKIDGKMIGQ